MKRVLSLALSIITACSLFVPVIALEETEVTFDTASYYPIIESEEWDNMEREERVSACQIPGKLLEQMSSDDLFQTVLEYPFMIDLYAFNTYAEGFQHVYNEFPALGALAARDDFGTVLIDFYQGTPVAKAGISLDYESIKNLSLVEILLAQPEITDSLSENEINSIISIAEEK